MAKFDYMPRPDQIYGLLDIMKATINNGFGVPGSTTDATHKRRVKSYNPSGATVQVNTVQEGVSYILMDQDCTLTLAKFASAGYQEVYLMIDPATFTLIWGETIAWVAGAPTLTASKLNIIRLFTLDSWGTIFGESVALGLTFTEDATHKAIAAYAFYGRDIHQFNMVTETYMSIAIDAMYWTDEELRPNTGTTAANIVSMGCAYMFGGALDVSMYTYSTNTAHTVGFPPYAEMETTGPPSMAVKPTDHEKMIGVGNGTDFINIHVPTFAAFFSGISLATANFTYGVTKSGFSAFFMAGNSNVVNEVFWTTEAIATAVLPETWYDPVAYAYDAEGGTGIGYILGGSDATGVTDDVVRMNSNGSFTQLSNILPIADVTSKGMAYDGLAIWAYRNTNSLKFTVATETAAVATNVGVTLSRPAVVHGDTFLV